MNYFQGNLAILLLQSPLYLTWLVGIVLALVFWKKHPVVSLLTVISLTWMLISSIVGTLLSVWLPVIMQRYGMPLTALGAFLSVRSLVSAVLNATAWIMLLVAIFGWRKAQQT